MTEPIDWQVLIGEMILTKNEILDLDPTYYDDYTLPNEGAETREIDEFERRISEGLPAEYRNFLLHANGWLSFYWDADLFGLPELSGEGGGAAASRLLSTYEQEGVLEDAGIRRQDVLPIGASSHSSTLFLLFRGNQPNAGQVSWLSGEEVDRYSSFAEFFASIIGYFKAHVEKLRS
jgi:SMI1/KNR4 family protein SUKH-1